MKRIFLIMLFAAFLISCDWLFDFPSDDDDAPLDPDQFYAVDFTNDSFYKVRATIKAEGKKCVIWAENGSGVKEDQAKEIADKYDNYIRPRIVGAFGMNMKDITEIDGEPIQFEDILVKDILDCANWLADKDDRKLTILLLDIKDNYNARTNPSYTAGYFYSGNFYPRDQRNSNGCDMIYVDTYPGLKEKPEETYATFAHELQHLINFATTVLLDRSRLMDTWIDEGLSSQAEHIYYEGTTFDNKDEVFDGNIKDHLKWFSEDKEGTIAQGNNFFVWGNHVTKEKPRPILDDYSTVYLFFRWLYLQADSKLQSSIFLDIETSESSDYRVITNVAKKINSEWEDWDKLLRSWLAANYYPTNSNYGYKSSYFKNITVKPLPTKSTPLYPGEGVYSRITSSFSTPSPSGNIRYAGLSSNSSSNVTQVSFNSDVLLTYNANTNNKATVEIGTLTGVSAGVSSTSPSRMAIEDEQTHTGPYRIDARDMSEILGRNK